VAERSRGPRPVQQRFERMLAMLPWLMAREEVPVAEVAERFGLRPDEVVRELEKLATCGLPPYQDELIDLWIEDGVIHVGIPRFFTRPVRPNTTEAFALLAAGRMLLAVPGADPDGALASALAKVEAALGGPVQLRVDLPEPPALATVRAALDAAEQLELDYVSAWRDARTTRTVDPWALFVERGHWYLVAWCHAAGDRRRFRVDRIEAARRVGRPSSTVAAPDATTDPVAFEPPEGATTVVLELPPDAAWVAETYPVEVLGDAPGGGLRVAAALAGTRWLERLLVRVGPGARVVEPPELAGLGAAAAARVLAVYRRDGPGGSTGG